VTPRSNVTWLLVDQKARQAIVLLTGKSSSLTVFTELLQAQDTDAALPDLNAAFTHC
jgi:hypothetical protein